MATLNLTFLFLMLCPSAYALTHAQLHAPELERAELQNNIENYARARVHPPPSPLTRRASIPAVGFYNPTGNGGSWLTKVDDTYPAGQGEPINVVISADSEASVLVDQEIDGGLQNYFNAFGYSTECLGQHQGSDQAANLGDGNGYVNQTAEIRWDYGDAEIGTCKETIVGGSHFRYWTQDGSAADSKAVFMAASYEEPETDNHNIVFNGYPSDWLVGNVTNQTHLISTGNVTNGTTYSGQTSFDGYTYATTAQYLRGYIPDTSYAVNHNGSVASATVNATDGFIAVLTVKVVASPKATSAALRSWTTPAWSVFPLVLALFVNMLATSIWIGL
ncbi:uncharacterized protein LAESUDRAFT_733810 [Laetiporus sulphureus 93-53]|uniref:Uncharacterized protein n=1 Tax=Laetiporus sulphureus 93-53 TaxID=1314785 RepID=A0A165HL80_9APHY|nr:uncharacterized protein LAESUDRAFT_733810 [Laetiporus sulphureus 93-53]KZT11875.1 hypothetical protein LAESUDRAFT_733810 [Laetiporus sulphureus 93-53]